jgi:hypothetical protein
MLDLKTVTHEDFAACLNQTFTIDDEAQGAVEIELVEVECQGNVALEAQGRPRFSILFLGAPEPLLAQGIYRLRHSQLGVMELFLVPVGPDQKGMRYEAVFT